MKKIIITILVILTVLNICSCSTQTQKYTNSEAYEHMTSKLENAVELQKSVFVAKVKSVADTEALIPKYNIDITDYTVYTVEITESLDGITPVGEALVYWIGASAEFATRVGLQKNEQYILDAEPWIYGDKVIYLLAPFTVSYPKIDSANRVTLASSDTQAQDLGTAEEYKQQYAAARDSVAQKNEGFFSSAALLSRYTEMFENIKTVNDDNWFRDFDYEFIPSDDFIETTRELADKAYSYILSLADKEITSEDITKLLKGDI